MRLASPPPDHVLPEAGTPKAKKSGALHIFNEIINKHFEGFTPCPLTSPHRFSLLTVVGKYAKVWHRPYLNRANNLSYIINSLSDHIIYAEGPLIIDKSATTRLFVRFHDEWTDLQFVEDKPSIDHFDYRRNKAYHAALDLGDVVVKSINIPLLKERLKDARFSLEQLVPGEVYHLIHSVVYSSKLRFLGDLQAAFLSEIPDDVFVTQYTQFHSLRDVVCRGVGTEQSPCPIAFKTCDFVIDSKGCLTLLERWDTAQPSSTANLINTLEPRHIISTDSVIGASYVRDCLKGLYPVLQTVSCDPSAIPRCLRLLRIVSGLSRKVTFPREKFTCRPTENSVLNSIGFTVRSAGGIRDIAVEPSSSDCMERARLYARVLAWCSGFPEEILSKLIAELTLEIPLPNKPVPRKKVTVSSSLQMSAV